MKKKLTTLLFGLLLAVGWTGNASAQALPNGGYADRLGLTEVTAPQGTSDVVKKAQKKTSQQLMSTNTGASTRMNAPKRADANPEMVSLTRAQAEALTYKWRDAQNVEHESNAAQEATDPYQMYELLRFVYGNPAFPGPRYTAWSNNDTREREVYYGPMEGGWDLVAASSAVQTGDDIVITVASGYVGIKSIYVYNGSTALTYWVGGTGTTAGTSPSSWIYDTNTDYYSTCRWISNGDGSWWLTYGDNTGGAGGKITIPYSALQGATNVRVVINTKTDDGYTQNDGVTTEQGDITVNGETQNIAESAFMDYTWELTVAEAPVEGEYVQGTVAAPNQEGYTALIVSVKDDATPMDETFTNYDQKNGNLFLNSKTEVINYFATRINYIKLLTDGMRIGSNSDYSRGTVFNCTGTYNKFFILGKGQSRQKDSYVVNTLEPYYGLMGEEGPFKYMFEEFSPVQPDTQTEITDFYKKMMEGSTYSVAHDCASVIQNNHQFSMTGNAGTDSYYLSGLNFFYPDYRLKYWTTSYTSGYYSYTVDGRTMNPYFSITGSSGTNGFRDCPSYCAHFAQYNQQYAPKMGIYKITLDAEASKNTEKDKTYNVTLTWVSSLNEMSGHEVDQLYTMYIVDEDGDTTKINPTQVTNLQDSEGNSITTNPCTVTQVTYEVPQNEHSYTIVYQIKGQENASGEPAFVALSNIDDVIIPGWNDFLSLSLDHYESDFKISEQKNWYRNFLLVANENEDNALTVKRINAGESLFKLYRYDYHDPKKVLTEIAELTFADNHDGKSVHYGVTYNTDNYRILRPEGNANKYELATMGIPTQGDLRINGNGDIIIYPNGYHVNFKSIEVYNGKTRLTYWNAPTSTTGTSPLPGDWILSPGSQWEPFTTDDNDRVYYIEGGGYIAIPDMLNNSNYNDLRVVIKAYGDGSSIARISVNDVPKKLQNNNPSYTTTWTFDANGAAHAPKRAIENHTSSLVFTANCNGSGTADDGATWTVTSDAAESNFDNTKGIHYGTKNASVSYLRLTTSSIPGTIKKIVVNASRGSNNAYLDVTVGGAAFGTQGLALTTSAEEYTFEGSASGQIVVELYKTDHNSTKQALYCKSVTVYYETEGGDNPPTPVEDGIIRLGHLPIVDQFNAPTDKNEHPRRYVYLLKYEPEQGDAKQSGTVEVPVLHTDAVVNGFYTADDVASDVDRHLTLDIMSADVTMNLPTGEPDLLHYRIQGKANGLPADNGDIISSMQQSSGRYREMNVNSPLYVADENFTYPAGELEYFNSKNPVTGEYGSNYETYAPTVTTWGLDRRYYETDHLDNTYGAPIWKTGVGQVRVISSEAQMQRGPNNSTQWTEKVTTGEGDQAVTTTTNCSLYFLGVEAFGDLPSTDVTNIIYEPYMFRVWIYSPSGKLRGCTYYEAGEGTDPNKPGAHWEGDGTSYTGPVCVYTGETTDGHLVLDLQDMSEGNNEPWSTKVQFGAVDNIDDLIVYVRYYYKSTGKVIGAQNMLRALRDGETPEVPKFYATENEDNPGISTGIVELWNNIYHGEVVSTTYVNAQGVISEKPFDGFNIVITRYSDGTVSTTKVVK